MNRTIALLIASYPHQDFPENTQDAYELMLQDIDPDLILAAAQHCITTHEKNFIPGIAELRHAVVDIQMMALGMPTPIEAWGEVQKSLSGEYVPSTSCLDAREIESALDGKTGREYWGIISDLKRHEDDCDKCIPSHTKKIEYSHPAIQRVVDAMGIKYLRESNNHVADRAHFFKAYEQVVTREQKEIVTLPQIKKLAEQKQIRGS